MKVFFLMLTLLTSVAFGGEVKIYEVPTWKADSISGTFELNEKLGRVWVELHLSDRFDYEDDWEYVRVKVENLTFDATSQTAFLDIDGQLVECAKVKSRGVLVFRHKYLRPTGCKFETRLVKKEIDDGFEIKTHSYLQVFIVTKD